MKQIELLIVRHAHALEREKWNDLGKPDALRPLTKRGIERFGESLPAFLKFIPKVDFMFCSHYTRAVGTAELLSKNWPQAKLEVLEALNPGHGTKAMRRMIRDIPDGSVAVIVGHQPELSELCSNLLGAGNNLRLRFKKGGAALITLHDDSAQLQWLLSARQLNGLAKN